MTIDQTDRKKNLEAGAYTALILVALALLLFLASWQLPNPVEPDPPLELQGIEVNLGTVESAFGNDQPMEPGEPAEQTASSPAQPAEEQGDNTADDPDSDVPVAKTQPNKTTTKPVVTSTPAPPKPKVTMPGRTAANSTGSTGNAADSYQKGKNQGIGKGDGDMGAPGGDPNSDSYSGNGRGNGGVRIKSGLGGRRVTSVPNFRDDFNENAKVAVDVTVDASGRVISTRVNLNGTTTANKKTQAIALETASKLRFNAGSGEQSGTLIIELKVSG